MRALSLSIVLLLCGVGLAAGADAGHRRLAEHYAPVVFQESRSTVLDFITSFDYDGDWKGDNNWRNAYLYDLAGRVYYGVIESTSHYFITYAFYHARDYTARPYEGFAPKTEHENDLEGLHADGREGRVGLRKGGAARNAGARHLLQVREPRQPQGRGRQPQDRRGDDVRRRPPGDLRRGRRARRQGRQPRRRGVGQLVSRHRLPLHRQGRGAGKQSRSQRDLRSRLDRRHAVGAPFRRGLDRSAAPTPTS